MRDQQKFFLFKLIFLQLLLGIQSLENSNLPFFDSQFENKTEIGQIGSFITKIGNETLIENATLNVLPNMTAILKAIHVDNQTVVTIPTTTAINLVSNSNFESTTTTSAVTTTIFQLPRLNAIAESDATTTTTTTTIATPETTTTVTIEVTESTSSTTTSTELNTTAETTTVETTTSFVLALTTETTEIVTTITPANTTVETIVLITTELSTTTIAPTTTTSTTSTTTTSTTTTSTTTTSTTTTSTTTTSTATTSTATTSTATTSTATTSTTTSTTTTSTTTTSTTTTSTTTSSTTTPSTTATTSTTTASTTTLTIPIVQNTTIESTTLPTTTESSTTAVLPVTEALTTTSVTVLQNQTSEVDFNSTNVPSNIQFEIKNITMISNNSSEPNSYSLRIRIKGYKWNNKFTNVSSQESQELLRKNILPLLYKTLKLQPSEVNEVKLLKLFKGSIQSELIVRSRSVLNITLLSHLNETLNGNLLFGNSTTRLLNNQTNNLNTNTTRVLFDLIYPLKIVATADLFEFKFLNSTFEQLIKQLLFKHFNGRLKKLEVKVFETDLFNVTEPVYPISLSLIIQSSMKLFPAEVTDAINRFAINQDECLLDDTNNQTVVCIKKPKTSTSLLRVSDFWIQLDISKVSASKIISLKDLFEFNSAWVFGLAIIACILAIFFIGCIIAICYTRKPYRRSGKVYDMESALFSNKLANKPSMYPTTKAHVIPKHKEVYY